MKLYITFLLVGLVSARQTSTDKTSVLASADGEVYDCNADGYEDCNDFNHGWPRGCRDSQKCYYKTHVWTGLMRGHCVCRRCFENDGAAAAKVPYDFQDMYQQRFRSWHRTDWTCAPWVFPRSDEEILDVLAYAREKGYKIRPAGSSHSTGGLVTGAGEDSYNTIALSLGRYVAPRGGDQDWEFELRTDNGAEDATAVVNAGWTQLMLYQQIRPLDYFLPSATAGPLFQLAGLVANTCHGGWYGKGYIHQYVVKMRVVTWDGTFKVIDDPQELRYWKSSFGLLGIILSVEFQLDHNPKFQQGSMIKKFAWNKENFWNFIKQDASADLPDDLGGPGPRQATNGQFFLDAYKAMDGEAEMSALVYRKNEHAVKDYEKPWFIEGAYQRQINEMVLDEDRTAEPWDGNPAVHRYVKYGTVMRENGGPDVVPWDDVSSVNNAVARNWRMMTGLTVTGPDMLLGTNSITVKDGFFATKVPQVLYSAYFIPAEHTFEAVNDIAHIYKRREDEDAPFKWNSGVEFRFVELDDGAILNQVPAGLYSVVEVIAFPFPEYGANEWHTFYEAFKEIQDLLQGPPYQGKAHMGKVFGLAEGDDGTVRPYQVEEACKVYTEEQKRDFLEYKQQMDPNGLFEAGDAMKLLSQCPTKCLPVNHQYVEPGEVTCDCVLPDNPCLIDLGEDGAQCIPDEECDPPPAPTVSCGNHRAPDCFQCPQGHGQGWCNGQCVWSESISQCESPTYPPPTPTCSDDVKDACEWGKSYRCYQSNYFSGGVDTSMELDTAHHRDLQSNDGRVIHYESTTKTTGTVPRTEVANAVQSAMSGGNVFEVVSSLGDKLVFRDITRNDMLLSAESGDLSKVFTVSGAFVKDTPEIKQKVSCPAEDAITCQVTELNNNVHPSDGLVDCFSEESNVIILKENVPAECMDEVYDMSLVVVPTPHFFLLGVKQDAEENKGCPPSIMLNSISGQKHMVAVVTADMAHLPMQAMGTAFLDDIIEAEANAEAIEDSLFDVFTNSCVHYAGSIWRSIGLNEDGLSNFIIEHIVNDSNIAQHAKNRGGAQALAAVEIGGHRALKKYVAEVVHAELALYGLL